MVTSESARPNRPLIGITTSYEDGQQRINHDYVRAVAQAGGVPVLVPMLDDPDQQAALAGVLDGLVIIGGPAITDGLVGALPDEISETDPVRSQSDRWTLGAVRAAGRPVLGICYGMQLLNAVAGGTIYADVQHQQADALAHSTKRGGTVHDIEVVPGTHLHRLLGQTRVSVNTRHLQAVASVPAPFRVAATAPDGVVEAIETAEGDVLGVQFHPEKMGEAMQPLFRHLVEQALARRDTARRPAG